MNLANKKQREKLLENGANRDKDHPPVVRLFMTNTECTWLINEMYEEEPGLAFGLCDLGLGFPEVGYCYLPEMQECQIPEKGMFLNIDDAFKGQFPLSAYAKAAYAQRQVIVDADLVKQYLKKPSP